MKFILCLLVSGIAITGCIYAAAALATIFRGEWKDGAFGFALAIIPLGIYVVAWQFLPLENWLIFPGFVALLSSSITFVYVIKNGV